MKTDAMFRVAFGSVSPAGSRARLSIFIFHRVLESPDPLFPDLPDAFEFERVMIWAKAWFNVLPLTEAAARLEKRSLPPRPLVITFDDGYADNATIAVPILQRLGLTATVFVCPGFLDGGRMWNDDIIEAIRVSQRDALDLSCIGLGTLSLGSISHRRRAIDRILESVKHRPYDERARCVHLVVDAAGGRGGPDLMMTSAQVRSLRAAGMSVGGHTLNHPILTRLTPASALAEIAQGKDQLEAITGERIDAFAYPNGLPGRDYAAEHVKMVRSLGFSCAVSTAWGVAQAGADVLQLPRFTPWARSRWRFGMQLLQNLQRTQFPVV